MDKSLGPVVRKLSERETDKYIGDMHYDWSYFELFEKDSIEPIILLRNPISRWLFTSGIHLTFVQICLKLPLQEDDSGRGR